MLQSDGSQREKRLEDMINELDAIQSNSSRDDLKDLRNAVSTELNRLKAESSSAVVKDTAASDDWKEQGNRAMAAKDFSAAVDCYSKSIALDSQNIAAFNNRALAHMKLNQYELAERDATSVLVLQNEGTIDVTIRKKALCRRAQSRRSCGQRLLQQHSQIGVDSSNAVTSFGSSSASEVTKARHLLNGALEDIDEWLNLDADNKSALNERRSTIQWLEFCEKAMKKKSTPRKSTTNTQPKRISTDTHSDVILPTKIPSDVGAFGMTPVSSKKFSCNTVAASESKDGSCTPKHAMRDSESAGSAPTPDVAKSRTSGRKLSTPPLTFVPREAPKTIYE